MSLPEDLMLIYFVERIVGLDPNELCHDELECTRKEMIELSTKAYQRPVDSPANYDWLYAWVAMVAWLPVAVFWFGVSPIFCHLINTDRRTGGFSPLIDENRA
jgi:hypothetical protein